MDHCVEILMHSCLGLSQKFKLSILFFFLAWGGGSNSGMNTFISFSTQGPHASYKNKNRRPSKEALAY